MKLEGIPQGEAQHSGIPPTKVGILVGVAVASGQLVAILMCIGCISSFHLRIVLSFNQQLVASNYIAKVRSHEISYQGKADHKRIKGTAITFYFGITTEWETSSTTSRNVHQYEMRNVHHLYPDVCHYDNPKPQYAMRTLRSLHLSSQLSITP